MKKKRLNPRGSIMIWTVMLGAVMTSVVFLMATRLRSNAAIERETIIKQNAKGYLESYVNYLMKHPAEVPETTVEGVKIHLTKEVDMIEGSADVSTPLTFTDDVTLYWNQCAQNNKVSLLINETLMSHNAASECAPSEAGYDDSTSVTAGQTIKPLGPIFYRAVPPAGSPAGTKITDTQWHLDASMDLGYGESIFSTIVF